MKGFLFYPITRGVLLAATVLFLTAAAKAQLPPNLDTALLGMTSTNVGTRLSSFYDLIIPLENGSGSTREGVRNLLRTNPGRTDQIKLALITALELAASYVRDLKERNEHFDEAFSGYYGDLIFAVTALRDPRSVKGLVGAIDTGGMAVETLADLGPPAVDAVITDVLGVSTGDHTAGIAVLREFLRRQETVRSNPDAAAKARRAILAALSDPDPSARRVAAGAALTFKDEPDVKARLEAVAAADYEARLEGDGKIHFPVRDEAARVLKANEADFFYVMRSVDTRECRVQRAVETPTGLKYLGPYDSSDEAAHQMCAHYDDAGKDPSVCGAISPKTACKP
jgi:hypothetical protein